MWNILANMGHSMQPLRCNKIKYKEANERDKIKNIHNLFNTQRCEQYRDGREAMSEVAMTKTICKESGKKSRRRVPLFVKTEKKRDDK